MVARVVAAELCACLAIHVSRPVDLLAVPAVHGLVGYDRITNEHVVRWDPEWIVAGAARGTVAESRARLLARPAIAATRAAQEGRVPNGSGKSTLLRVLAGLWSPHTGSVLIEGVHLRTLTRTEIARRVGFLPQDTRCDFAFTVEERVTMGRHAHRGSDRADARGRLAIDVAIATCELSGLRHRSVDRVSGSERHRVAIARCLASEPQTLVLDEPTAHLDVQHAPNIFALGRSLVESGHALVVTTHDVRAVARVATAGIVRNGGRLVAAGSLPDILTKDLCRDGFRVERHDARHGNEQPILVFSSATANKRRRESVA